MPQSPKVESFLKQPMSAFDLNSTSGGMSSETVFNFSSSMALDMSSNQKEKSAGDNYFVKNSKGNTMNVIFRNSSNSLIIPQSSTSNHSNINEKAKPLTIQTVILPTNEKLNACISTPPILINQNLEKRSLDIKTQQLKFSGSSLNNNSNKNIDIIKEGNIVEHSNQNHSSPRSVMIIDNNNINTVKSNLLNTQILIPSMMPCPKASNSLSTGGNIQTTNIKYAKQDTNSSDGNSGILVLTQSSLADILNSNTLTTTNSRNSNNYKRETGDVRKPVSQQFLMINSSNINTNLQVTCSPSASTVASPTTGSVPSLITTNQILTGQKSIMLAVNNNSQQTVKTIKSQNQIFFYNFFFVYF